MIRNKAAALFFLAALALPIGILAQPNPPEGSPPAGIGITAQDLTNPFLKGAQTISLAGGSTIPLFELGNPATSITNLMPGFAFGISYQYFIERGIAIGGTLSGAFNQTKAERSLFTSPLTFRFALWTAKLPFEFFGAAEAGLFIMRLDTKGTFGPFLKLGGGALWKAPNGWSLGLQSNYWLVPELHFEDADLTRVVNHLEIGLCAVYYL
jgi:hypothetical protein